MAENSSRQSFIDRYAATRSKADEEVADWITGRGQFVILGVVVLLALGFVGQLVADLL